MIALRVLAVAIALSGPAIAHVAAEPVIDPIEEVQAFEGGGGVGSLSLPVGGPDLRTPVVIILQDSLGSDGRSSRYVDQLLGAGFAVLDLLAAERLDLHALIATLAEHPRILGGHVALMGFGAGARLAAEWPGQVRARALLYPGCESVVPAPMPGEAVLLMHGDADVANAPAACDALARRIAARVVRQRVYAGAAYAWDRPMFGIERAVMVPRPDGAGRISAVAWPAMAAYSASEVAGFFASGMRGPR